MGSGWWGEQGPPADLSQPALAAGRGRWADPQPRSGLGGASARALVPPGVWDACASVRRCHTHGAEGLARSVWAVGFRSGMISHGRRTCGADGPDQRGTRVAP
eukprot:279878-Chlamydomonas_euryale.AAC.4